MLKWHDVVDIAESVRPEDSHGAISNCWDVCPQGITNCMGSFVVQRVLETSLFDILNQGVLELVLVGLPDCEAFHISRGATSGFVF